jgi:hypothetical protein
VKEKCVWGFQILVLLLAGRMVPTSGGQTDVCVYCTRHVHDMAHASVEG